MKSVIRFRSPTTVETPAGFFQYKGRPYRETLRIHALPSGECEVVNEVDLEKYLDGLVNSEFSSQWSEEAVAAQAIAARTYAFYQMREAHMRPEAHYDVDSTTKDQVYDGSYR